MKTTLMTVVAASLLAVGCGGSQAEPTPAGTTGNLCGAKDPVPQTAVTKDDIIKDVLAAVRSGDGSSLEKHFPTFDEVAAACPSFKDNPQAKEHFDKELAEGPARLKEQIAACGDMIDLDSAEQGQPVADDVGGGDCPGLSSHQNLKIPFQADGNAYELHIQIAVLQSGRAFLGTPPSCSTPE